MGSSPRARALCPRFFGGENLDKVNLEKDAITSVLKQKQKQCFAFDMGALNVVFNQVCPRFSP